jgi:hypothetical protein
LGLVRIRATVAVGALIVAVVAGGAGGRVWLEAVGAVSVAGGGLLEGGDVGAGGCSRCRCLLAGGGGGFCVCVVVGAGGGACSCFFVVVVGGGGGGGAVVTGAVVTGAVVAGAVVAGAVVAGTVGAGALVEGGGGAGVVATDEDGGGGGGVVVGVVSDGAGVVDVGTEPGGGPGGSWRAPATGIAASASSAAATRTATAVDRLPRLSVLPCFISPSLLVSPWAASQTPGDCASGVHWQRTKGSVAGGCKNRWLSTRFQVAPEARKACSDLEPKPFAVISWRAQPHRGGCSAGAPRRSQLFVVTQHPDLR